MIDKSEFNELVKIDCKMTECVYNKDNNCGLKGITIGIGIIIDYPHGIKAKCISFTDKDE